MHAFVNGARHIDVRYGIAGGVMLILPLFWIINDARNDDPGNYRYLVPLVAAYYVQNYNSSPPAIDSRWGPFQIVSVGPGYNLKEDWDPILAVGDESSVTAEFLPNVEKLAIVQNKYIVGEIRSGYFILNITGPTLQRFNSITAYHDALKANQIEDLVPESPDELARKFPSRLIRPWMYRAMGERLGLSDLAWSSITEDTGLATAIIAGMAIPRLYRWKRRWKARVFGFIFGVVLGCCVNYVANGWMLYSGPDSFIGQLALPPAYGIAAMLSEDVANLFYKVTLMIFPGRENRTCS